MELRMRVGGKVCRSVVGSGVVVGVGTCQVEIERALQLSRIWM